MLDYIKQYVDGAYSGAIVHFNQVIGSLAAPAISFLCIGLVFLLLAVWRRRTI
ncbi:MAG: hypothetical protein ACM3TU_03640 [Bacillota bacterium]